MMKTQTDSLLPGSPELLACNAVDVTNAGDLNNDGSPPPAKTDGDPG